MILVVSSPDDVHAKAVMEALDSMGARAVLLDLSLFPQSMRLAMHYSNEQGGCSSLALPGHGEFRVRECRVVWWRRPQLFVINPEIGDPVNREFAYSESSHAFAGLWQTHRAFWVNHPVRHEVASRKGYQLQVAHEVGLEIPETVITNDPSEAREFINRCGWEQVIYKPFAATSRVWRETRRLWPEELDLLESVRFSPVLFQEYIPAQFDLRVTAVGSDLFSAAIHSQESAYPVDCRMDLARTRITPYALPQKVEQAIHVLMERLEIVYGAIDLRLTPEGRHVFLEVNPAGQWLFVERQTGQPITASLAGLLAASDELPT